jgi:hypothetical protein
MHILHAQMMDVPLAEQPCPAVSDAQYLVLQGPGPLRDTPDGSVKPGAIATAGQHTDTQSRELLSYFCLPSRTACLNGLDGSLTSA